MKKIVIASGNPGKIKELQAILSPLGWECLPQSGWDIPEADETGTTFIENAIIKARHAAVLTGLPALADDSGLEIDALHGEPGVYSARYAGPEADFKANINLALKKLKEHPEAPRTARFHCVIALIQHAGDPAPKVFHGTWEGEITEEPCGTQGFGYDPIFYVPEHDCTAAELDPEIKNQLSHRAKAMKKLFANS